MAALRFIRGIGGHDNISARKFLDAAKQTDDVMLFYTIFRFFEQRNQRLRGNPNFTPGEGRPRVTTDSRSPPHPGGCEHGFRMLMELNYTQEGVFGAEAFRVGFRHLQVTLKRKVVIKQNARKDKLGH